MWKKVIGGAFAAALFVVGIALLRWVSTPTQASVEPVANNTSTVATKPISRSSLSISNAVASGESAAAPAGSNQAEPDDDPTQHGPSAGVWSVLRKGSATVADEREGLVTALRAASPCIEKWCASGRSTVDAWVAQAASKVPGAIKADAVECSSAGCWARVTVSDAQGWRELSAALSEITTERPWTGPSIIGGPDFVTQRGSVISLWAILPVVSSDKPIPEQGVE